METPNLPAIRAICPAWNKRRVVGQKRPLKPKHVCAIQERLELAEHHRDLALFNMGIGSNLRGCDLVRMHVVDIMAYGHVKDVRISFAQQGANARSIRDIGKDARQSRSGWKMS